jgi:hypothetical protein
MFFIKETEIYLLKNVLIIGFERNKRDKQKQSGKLMEESKELALSQTRALAPYELLHPKKMERCLFYEFHFAMRTLMDSEGNQYALLVDRYISCERKFAGKKPDWNFCALNTPLRSALLEFIAE